MATKRADRPLLLVCSTLVSFAAALTVRIAWVDEQQAKRDAAPIEEDFLRSPGHDVLQLIALEQPLGLSDLAWLGIVQTLGRASAATAGHWDRVQRWAWIAVDLDPYYYIVYHSVATHLTVFGRRPKASDALLLRGHQMIPDRWELPFMLAYNACFLKMDFAEAGRWLETASKLPNSPAHLPALAGRMRFQGGQAEGALSFLEMMLKQAEPGSRMYRELDYRYAALKSEPRLREFDEACKRHKAERGAPPPDAQALVDLGWVKGPALDAFGDPISFKGDCIAVTRRIHTREKELEDFIRKQLEREGLQEL